MSRSRVHAAPREQGHRTASGPARGTSRPAVAAAVSVLLAAGCATLGLEGLVRHPSFEHEANRSSRLRVVPPEAGRPGGGAELRVWTRVGNPNSFGISVTRLSGDLLLEDAGGIEFDLPMGLPLEAGADTVVPLDLSVGFGEVPRLLSVVTEAAVSGRAVEVALRGTVGVDAGRLGDLVFGPLTFLRAEVPVRRR